MKKLLFIPVLVLLAVLALIFLPGESEALNANHQCASCHQNHDAAGPSLGNASDTETVCLTCHGPAGVSTLKATIHENKPGSTYASFRVTCGDCHDSHDNQENWLGGTNIKMVGRMFDNTPPAKIVTPLNGLQDVAFEQYGDDTDPQDPLLTLHSFADTDQDSNSTLDGVCEVCHINTTEHNNTRTDVHHDSGAVCITCHPHDAGFTATGGGCTTCHDKVQDEDTGDGVPARRIIAGASGEFVKTSHHVSGGTPTDDDCKVCHMERESGYHKNGVIDLRDPDTGTAITGFTQFSRNRASNTLEAWVVAAQDQLCMKCHDSDGAAAETSPTQPFSTGGTPSNVFGQFDTGNPNHHAVRGAGSNDYTTSSTANGNNVTMESPWNQGANDHDLISCFDCHAINGHGSDNQRMLRDPIDFAFMEAAGLSTTVGGTVETFCTRCHKASVYVNAGDPEAVGSIFEDHGAGRSQHRAAGGNELGCMGCHGGTVDWSAGVPPGGNGSAKGNLHGVSYTWPTGTWSVGTPTEHFMVGGWNSGWDTAGSLGQCGGGDCNHKGSATKAGKNYTR